MDKLLVSYHSEASIHPREVSGGSLTQAASVEQLRLVRDDMG